MRINNPMDMGGNPLLTGVAVSELLSGNGTSGDPLKFNGLSVSDSSGTTMSGSVTSFKEGKGISLTGSGNEIVISSKLDQGGIRVSSVAGSSVQAVAGSQYVCLNAKGCVVTLPASAAENSVVEVSAQALDEGSVVRVNPPSGDTVAGSGFLELDTSYSFVELVRVGKDWKAVMPFSPLSYGVAEAASAMSLSSSWNPSGVIEVLESLPPAWSPADDGLVFMWTGGEASSCGVSLRDGVIYRVSADGSGCAVEVCPAYSPCHLDCVELSGSRVSVSPCAGVYRWRVSGPCELLFSGWPVHGEQSVGIYIDASADADVSLPEGVVSHGGIVRGKMNYCSVRSFEGRVRFSVLESY